MEAESEGGIRNLSKIKIYTKIVTFEEYTKGMSVVIILDNGCVLYYENDGYLELIGTYGSFKDFLNYIGLYEKDFKELYDYDSKLTKIVSKVYANVEKVFTGWL